MARMEPEWLIQSLAEARRAMELYKEQMNKEPEVVAAPKKKAMKKWWWYSWNKGYNWVSTYKYVVPNENSYDAAIDACEKEKVVAPEVSYSATQSACVEEVVLGIGYSAAIGACKKEGISEISYSAIKSACESGSSGRPPDGVKQLEKTLKKRKKWSNSCRL